MIPAIVFICLTLFVNCNNPVNGGENNRFTFCVADIGQGLSQFGVMGGRAVVWDMGPPDQYAAWRAAYGGLGSPRVEMIAISHSDADHLGGLQRLDGGVNWSGVTVVSPFEDTAKIRASAGVWSSRVEFRFCVSGDTLRVFNSVEIVCLWPPAEIEAELPLDGVMRNRYSLVFSVRHGRSRALVTSDVDSAAMNEIAARSGYDLRAQILSVPHHGSAGSVSPLFFAYASPEIAVISCARQNSYGHPTRQMIDALDMLGVNLLYTYLDNTVTFVSNGYYW